MLINIAVQDMEAFKSEKYGFECNANMSFIALGESYPVEHECSRCKGSRETCHIVIYD